MKPLESRYKLFLYSDLIAFVWMLLQIAEKLKAAIRHHTFCAPLIAIVKTIQTDIHTYHYLSSYTEIICSNYLLRCMKT